MRKFTTLSVGYDPYVPCRKIKDDLTNGASRGEDEAGVRHVDVNARDWIKRIEADPSLQEIYLFFLRLRDFTRTVERVKADFRDISTFNNYLYFLQNNEGDHPEEAEQCMLELFPYYNCFEREFKDLLELLRRQNLPDTPNLDDFKRRLQAVEDKVNGDGHRGPLKEYWNTDRWRGTSKEELARMIFGDVSLMLEELNIWITDLMIRSVTERDARVETTMQGKEQEIGSLRIQRNALIGLILMGLVAVGLKTCNGEKSDSMPPQTSAAQNEPSYKSTPEAKKDTEPVSKKVPKKKSDSCKGQNRFYESGVSPYFEDKNCTELVRTDSEYTQDAYQVTWQCPEGRYRVAYPGPNSLLSQKLESCDLEGK